MLLLVVLERGKSTGQGLFILPFCFKYFPTAGKRMSISVLPVGRGAPSECSSGCLAAGGKGDQREGAKAVSGFAMDREAGQGTTIWEFPSGRGRIFSDISIDEAMKD